MRCGAWSWATLKTAIDISHWKQPRLRETRAPVMCSSKCYQDFAVLSTIRTRSNAATADRTNGLLLNPVRYFDISDAHGATLPAQDKEASLWWGSLWITQQGRLLPIRLFAVAVGARHISSHGARL
jgi:hypothetical protein